MAINARRASGPERLDRAPVGIHVATGAVALVAAAFVATAIPVAYPQWRFGLMVVAVAGFAAICRDRAAVGVIAVIAFAIDNGFMEDRYGQLSWHGSSDVWRLLALAVVWSLTPAMRRNR